MSYMRAFNLSLVMRRRYSVGTPREISGINEMYKKEKAQMINSYRVFTIVLLLFSHSIVYSQNAIEREFSGEYQGSEDQAPSEVKALAKRNALRNATQAIAGIYISSFSKIEMQVLIADEIDTWSALKMKVLLESCHYDNSFKAICEVTVEVDQRDIDEFRNYLRDIQKRLAKQAIEIMNGDRIIDNGMIVDCKEVTDKKDQFECYYSLLVKKGKKNSSVIDKLAPYFYEAMNGYRNIGYLEVANAILKRMVDDVGQYQDNIDLAENMIKSIKANMKHNVIIEFKEEDKSNVRNHIVGRLIQNLSKEKNVFDNIAVAETTPYQKDREERLPIYSEEKNILVGIKSNIRLENPKHLPSTYETIDYNCQPDEEKIQPAYNKALRKLNESKRIYDKYRSKVNECQHTFDWQCSEHKRRMEEWEVWYYKHREELKKCIRTRDKCSKHQYEIRHYSKQALLSYEISIRKERFYTLIEYISKTEPHHEKDYEVKENRSYGVSGHPLSFKSDRETTELLSKRASENMAQFIMNGIVKVRDQYYEEALKLRYSVNKNDLINATIMLYRYVYMDVGKSPSHKDEAERIIKEIAFQLIKKQLET